MSFGGHALDMIRRQKNDRAQLRLSRERRKELQSKILGEGGSYKNIHLTVEELEKIKEATEAKEKNDRNYFFKYTIALLLFSAVVLFIGWALFF